MTLRVGVDVTELAGGGVGGVRTALRLLLSALAAHTDLRLVGLAPESVALPEGVEMRATGGPRRARDWRRCAALARVAEDLDVFHSPVTAHPRPHILDMPSTATVHELPFVVHPRYEGLVRAIRQWQWLGRALVDCVSVVVPSDATRKQLLAVHPGADDRIRVIPHPAPPVPSDGELRDEGYLLFVGRLDRRKAIRLLLRGAEGFEGPVLLAGPHGAKEKRQILRWAGRREVRFLGVVPEAELDRLYRGARAVGLVSASEGFGFPVLEALGRGVPVIVARGTGAAEVGGDAAFAVEAGRPGEIAAALERAADPNERARIAREGPARVATFDPRRCAEAYAEVFRRAAHR